MGKVTRRDVAAFRLVAALVSFLVALLAHGGTVDRVAARINGEILTESDLQKFLRENGASTLSPESVGRLFDRTLLLQEARRQKIDIPDDELQRQVEETVRNLRGKYPTEKEFMAALAAEGMNLEKLKAELLKRSRTDFQVYQAVTAGTSVSSEDVRQYEQNLEREGRSPVSLHLRRLGVAA